MLCGTSIVGSLNKTSKKRKKKNKKTTKKKTHQLNPKKNFD